MKKIIFSLLFLFPLTAKAEPEMIIEDDIHISKEKYSSYCVIDEKLIPNKNSNAKKDDLEKAIIEQNKTIREWLIEGTRKNLNKKKLNEDCKNPDIKVMLHYELEKKEKYVPGRFYQQPYYFRPKIVFTPWGPVKRSSRIFLSTYTYYQQPYQYTAEYLMVYIKLEDSKTKELLYLGKHEDIKPKIKRKALEKFSKKTLKYLKVRK